MKIRKEAEMDTVSLRIYFSLYDYTKGLNPWHEKGMLDTKGRQKNGRLHFLNRSENYLQEKARNRWNIKPLANILLHER